MGCNADACRFAESPVRVCVCVFSVPAVMRGRVLALVAWINVRSPVRHRDNRYWGII